MKRLNALAAGTALFTMVVPAQATVISFLSGSDTTGTSLSFASGSLTVTGGVAKSNVLTGSSFTRNKISMSKIFQGSGMTGLGVCSEAPFDCSDSTNRFSSNTNTSSPGGDEILFFNFNELTSFDKVSFNGAHKELVDHDNK